MSSGRLPSDVPYVAATNLNVVATYHSSNDFIQPLADANVRRIAIGFSAAELTFDSRVNNVGMIGQYPSISVPSNTTVWLYYKDVGPLVWQPWWWIQQNGASGSMSVYELLLIR